MQIEVFSDVVCPWCYLGKRRLEAALAEVVGTAEVTWRAFQLQPDGPRLGGRGAGGRPAGACATGVPPDEIGEMQGRLAALAAEEGLDYAPDRAPPVNSFGAHRLARAGGRHGRGEE